MTLIQTVYPNHIALRMSKQEERSAEIGAPEPVFKK